MPEIVRCPHCGIQQYENPNSDPAQAAMAYLCWKCVKPLTSDKDGGTFD